MTKDFFNIQLYIHEWKTDVWKSEILKTYQLKEDAYKVQYW